MTRGSEGTGHSEGDHWPREFGRDGVSGLLTPDRALRARDVSQPSEQDMAHAESVIDELLARVEGKRVTRQSGARGSARTPPSAGSGGRGAPRR